MSKETSFNITMNVAVEPEGDQGRFKVTQTMSATDAGQPFCDSVITWHDMSQDNVDYVSSLFSEFTGGDGNVEIIGTSYKQLLKLQREGMKVLHHLNELGEAMVDKTREEKAEMAKALLADKRGKAKGHDK